jgi:hypothetical protein
MQIKIERDGDEESDDGKDVILLVGELRGRNIPAPWH